MDIGSIFLILAIFIPVLLFISRPLVERAAAKAVRSGQDISTLLAERDQVVGSLQELDDDYQLGKIPSENYPAQRQSLLQSGAEILRQIDLQQATLQAVPAHERLEAAIASRRQAEQSEHVKAKKNGNAVPPVPDDYLEQRIASRRRTMLGKAGGFCPKCGRPIQSGDRFCPKCGATLS